MLLITRLCLLTICCLLFSNVFAQSGRELVEQAIKNTHEIHSLEYKSITRERIHNQLTPPHKALVRMTTEPAHIFYQQLEGDKQELIYIEGENNNMVKVIPDGFPWIPISLNLQSKLLRKNRHHTIDRLGYGYLMSILSHIVSKFDANSESKFIHEKDTIFDQIPCYVVEFHNHAFGYYLYRAEGNEHICNIAQKLGINDYRIIELNKNIDDYGQIATGDRIMVPSDYAKKMIMFIHKKSLLPVKVAVFDDIGLYEIFEFHNLNINPHFTKTTFTTSGKQAG